MNTLEIQRITIILREVGTDIILMYINNLTQPVYPDTDQLCVQTYARAEHGEQSVQETFPGVPYNVINSRG